MVGAPLALGHLAPVADAALRRFAADRTSAFHPMCDPRFGPCTSASHSVVRTTPPMLAASATAPSTPTRHAYASPTMGCSFPSGSRMPLDVVETVRALVRIPSINPMGREVTGPEYLEHAVTD